MRRLLALTALLAACSTPPEKICTPGKSEACVGTGGCAGGQVCNAAGSGFGSCDCGTNSDAGLQHPDSGVDSGTIDAGTDAGTDAGADAGTDAGVQCDPAAQLGCGTSEKCAWVTVSSAPDLGQLGCVPNGDAGLGQPCTQGVVGPTTGYDNCVKGAVCINDTCARVCDIADAGCPFEVCTLYSGLFANQDEQPSFGACKPGCDPLAQTTLDGGSCGVNTGCYLLVSTETTIAVCAGAGTTALGQPISGTVFGNSCVPGGISRRASSSTSTFECGALCAPADVTLGVNPQHEGGVAPNDCVTRGGAAAPSDPDAGESCTYLWTREPSPALTPYSNTVGWCFPRAKFWYDSDGGTNYDTPWPRCIDITTQDLVPPYNGTSDALYFGCVQSPQMRSLAPGHRVRPSSAVVPHLDQLGGWR